MATSFGPLRYLYVGTTDVERDLRYYTKVLGAEKVWDISSFGVRVAPLRLGEGPLLLLADHRPARSCVLIFQVENLAATAKELRGRGWKPESGQFEIPDGPCYRFNDPSGNPLALFQEVRPGVLSEASGKPRGRLRVMARKRKSVPQTVASCYSIIVRQVTAIFPYSEGS